MAAAAVAFVAIEHRAEDPVMPLSLFRSRLLGIADAATDGWTDDHLDRQRYRHQQDRQTHRHLHCGRSIVNAYADSLAPVFCYLVPFLAVAFVLALFIKQVKLSDVSGIADSSGRRNTSVREVS